MECGAAAEQVRARDAGAKTGQGIRGVSGER